MTVLQLNRKIQKLIGLYRENTTDPMGSAYMIAMNVLYLVALVYILIWGSMAFIFANLTDFEKSTNAMYNIHEL